LVNKWVLISYSVVSMFEFEQRKCQGQFESGGILVGAYRGPHIEIFSFTTPGPKDLRQAYSFVKRDPSHQSTATNAWKQSRGKATYLGEWHTHPLGAPEPSAIDRHTWLDITATSKRIMIFAIVAPFGWRIYWCDKKGLRTTIAPMDVVEHGQTGIVLGLQETLFRSWSR